MYGLFIKESKMLEVELSIRLYDPSLACLGLTHTKICKLVLLSILLSLSQLGLAHRLPMSFRPTCPFK